MIQSLVLFWNIRTKGIHGVYGKEQILFEEWFFFFNTEVSWQIWKRQQKDDVQNHNWKGCSLRNITIPSEKNIRQLFVAPFVSRLSGKWQCNEKFWMKIFTFSNLEEKNLKKKKSVYTQWQICLSNRKKEKKKLANANEHEHCFTASDKYHTGQKSMKYRLATTKTVVFNRRKRDKCGICVWQMYLAVAGVLGKWENGAESEKTATNDEKLFFPWNFRERSSIFVRFAAVLLRRGAAGPALDNGQRCVITDRWKYLYFKYRTAWNWIRGGRK